MLAFEACAEGLCPRSSLSACVASLQPEAYSTISALSEMATMVEDTSLRSVRVDKNHHVHRTIAHQQSPVKDKAFRG